NVHPALVRLLRRIALNSINLQVNRHASSFAAKPDLDFKGLLMTQLEPKANSHELSMNPRISTITMIDLQASRKL
ncbi:hypothetical protein ACTJJ7_03940, partial [Phyllobacterium sp. 22229]|uniref:hypothetical protein n=1 Tax=Phyllobacterium sp. 22229 TaxID=3453895 RepID=UPI003F87D8E3